MASLTESSVFEAGIYQLELTDLVLGGATGISNLPQKQLANRTRYLYDHVTALENAGFATVTQLNTAIATRQPVSAVGGYVERGVIPDTVSAAQWVKLGTFTAGQAGETCKLRLYLHNGYSANPAQAATVDITFKVSNGTAVDANGYAGDCIWHSVGPSGAMGASSVKWKANAAGVAATSHDLYLFLPTFTKNSSYEVVVGGGAWTHAGTIGQVDPGAGSSTVLVASADLTFATPPKAPTPATADNSTLLATTAWVRNVILSSIWPVGSIYTTTDAGFNPAAAFGGTWSQYAQGRVLVGQDAGQTEFDALGETGGEKAHTLTIDEIPSHNHTLATDTGGSSNVLSLANTDNSDENPTGAVTGSTGGGLPHNNLQPYVVVRFWRRTA